ncbi:MAG TPA: endo-1,4-beta-xylanase, partial [Stenotrophomonas sp.]|nr:endo-1,4-beta-xylanase [Stenotrophomonas sp.]
MTRARPRLALLALAAASCLAALPAYAAPPSTLKDAFHDDFLVGVAVNDAIVSGRDARSQALVVAQFNS